MWTKEQLEAKLKTGKVKIKAGNGLKLSNPALHLSKPKKTPLLQKVGNSVVEVTDTPKLYVGIDPDRKESGVAVWDSVKQDFILLDCMKFVKLVKFMDLIKSMAENQNYELIWLVEYGKGNPAIFGSEKYKVSRARKTGWNEETGEKICEFLQDKGIFFKKVVPKKNRYAHFGVSKGKVSQEILNHITNSRFQYKINPFQKIRKSKLNQEIRDALMMVYKLY